MSFLDKLKEIIKIDFKLDAHDLVHNLITVNIIRNEQLPPVDYRKEAKEVIINLDKLPVPQQEQIKSLIAPAVTEEGLLLLDEKAKETLQSIDVEEGLDEERKILDFYKDKIPLEDFLALRASLHLRQRFRAHALREEIYSLRNQIIKTFPTHGENISKMCSSGYFETWLKRVYDVMSGVPGFKKEDFIKVFHLFIEEGAFAVFVSERMSSGDVQSAIEGERATQIRYGVTDPCVIIHAIGRNNIENANMAIYSLKEKYTHLSVQRTDDMNIYFARVIFN